MSGPLPIVDDEPQNLAVMRQILSPEYPAIVLARSDSPVFRMAAEIALKHHERWDGSSYPQGLQGIAISEAARIVAIADVFDALTMKRPYASRCA